MTFESFSSWNELAQLLYWQNNLSLDSGYRQLSLAKGNPQRSQPAEDRAVGPAA